MAIEKPSIPRGTRDFGPTEMARRQHIFAIIKETFELFGFQALETPSFENLSVLQGKYGEEGDQLIYKILNSGNFLDKTTVDDFEAGYKSLTKKISEKALRYDLTVPFARYVVMNRGQLTFPFKRYQIQPVWRADRPQKGRYREFYQCDADVVGTDSLLCEAEIILMIDRVLSKLGIKDFTIAINNRKILSAMAAAAGAEGKEAEMCVAIDKLDKIGKEGVTKELQEQGFTIESCETLFQIINSEASFSDTKKLGNLFLEKLGENNPGQKGIEELKAIVGWLEAMGLFDNLNSKVKLNLSLARGLSYYTGTIFEVKANNVQIGSISGGGRYDNLTGLFGLPGVSGVGFSFGVDRIYDVMQELDLFVALEKPAVQVLVAHFGEATLRNSAVLLTRLREAGIRAEMYPEEAKLKKQFTYADAKRIPYIAMIGTDEAEKQMVALRNMASSEQSLVPNQEIISRLVTELSATY